MLELFTTENLLNLIFLLFLQAVLGFDNLLYISIESRRAPKAQQQAVRRWGIIIAVALRIVLLLIMLKLLQTLTDPLFHIQVEGIIEGHFNFASLVFLLGGAFLMYTAVKEIAHLIGTPDLVHEKSERKASSAVKVTAFIVIMNLIFSFDSILSAIAITDVVPLLAIAIVASGIAMYLLADRITLFIQNNREYEILGLFILLIVGVVLIGDGGHQAHLKLFSFVVEPMSKATFYFSLVVLVIVNILQGKYQDRLEAKAAKETQA
jgi:predicted tellurium resistance membrane protein TerC